MKKIFLFFILQLYCYNFANENIQILDKNKDGSQLPSFATCCEAISRRALAYTNTFRRQNGRPPLAWNQRMANLAYNHSVNMGVGRVPFSHQGFANRVRKFGFPVRAAGENLFFTNRPGDIARFAVNAWIQSPGHRRNLLGNYNLCGIGTFKNSRGFWYMTQEFALR